MSARFLNVDLILKARFDLRPLTQVLTNGGLFLLGDVTVKGGVWRATFESDHPRPTPKTAMNRLLSVVEGLGEADRQRWDRCSHKCFDFGFECGEAFESSYPVSADHVARIAKLGASIAITIYRGEA